MLQYLIKWKGYPESDNTWENADQVHAPELIKLYHRTNAQGVIKAQRIRLERKHPSIIFPCLLPRRIPELSPSRRTAAHICSVMTWSSSAATTACSLPPKSTGPTTINSLASIAATSIVPSVHDRSTTKTSSRLTLSTSTPPTPRQDDDSYRHRLYPHHPTHRACTVAISLPSTAAAVISSHPHFVTSISTDSSANYPDATTVLSAQRLSQPASITSGISPTSTSFIHLLYTGSDRWNPPVAPPAIASGLSHPSARPRDHVSTLSRESRFDTSSSGSPTTFHRIMPANTNAFVSSTIVRSIISRRREARANVCRRLSSSGG
jgi:Chromo (CHRromatin Organisation MOdifier) domain